jgi:hypothetical protein
MPFPNSNLSSNAQPWARDVQKRIESLESNVKANEINNTARDVQLDNNYKRLDKAVNDLIVADAAIITATQQAQDAADDAAAAASAAASAANTANNAASAAQAAANTANSAIAILSSLTTFTYYPGTSATWSGSGLNQLVIDYYGSTYIDIPESGGSRKVTVTAVFDVDMATLTTAASTLSRQVANARMYGTSDTADNSLYSGINRGSNTGNISVSGGGSLTVTGSYDVNASGTLSWNPDLTIATGTGTFSGSANLRFVTVVITKV